MIARHEMQILSILHIALSKANEVFDYAVVLSLFLNSMLLFYQIVEETFNQMEFWLVAYDSGKKNEGQMSNFKGRLIRY